MWSDPFSPGTLWLVRAHGEGRKTIWEWLTEVATYQSDGGDPLLMFKIRMRTGVSRTNNDRVVLVTYMDKEWLPFDLDATLWLDSLYAREAVKLTGVTYSLMDQATKEE